MDLRGYCNILLLLIGTLNFSFAQETEVRCVNPYFDQLVDSYLDYEVPAISVADAYESRDKYIFLDAREFEEYTTSHIPDAIHIGYDNFDLEVILSQFPKDAQLVVYCSIGYRSEKIGKILNKNGYKVVHNLYGSIFEWVNQHHIIHNQNGNPTQKLHTYNKQWSKWVENEDIVKTW